jgi:hypothetical protein
MNEKKNALSLDEFRESLKDVVVVVEKLSKYTDTYEQLISMCSLAIENDAQLRILIKEVHGK